MSRNERVDLGQFGRAASHLRRLFEVLGVERRPRQPLGVHVWEVFFLVPRTVEAVPRYPRSASRLAALTGASL